MINLFESGAATSRATIRESVIKSESFFSMYDAKQSSTFSFGPNIHMKIMEGYAERREQEFENKYGKSPYEFLDEASIHQDIYDSQKDFLSLMDRENEKFVVKMNNAKTSLKELGEMKNKADRNEAKVKRLLKDIKEWESATQNYLNVMSEVGDSFADAKKISIQNISGQTPKGLALGTNALTSYEKASLALKEVRKKVKEIESDVNAIDDLGIVYKKVSGGKIVRGKEHKSLDVDLLDSMRGYISSAKGIIFEIATANALHDTANEMVKEVLMLGQADGVKIKSSSGKQISQMKTSKTDIAYVDGKTGFQVNLSLKNQPKTSLRATRTGFLTTNLAQFLTMTTESEYQERLLGSYLLINKRDPAMNLFLSALVADMAIGSGGIDKVDFLVFNNGIVSLSDYYRSMSGKIRMDVAISKSDKFSKRALLSGTIGMPNAKISVGAQ